MKRDLAGRPPSAGAALVALCALAGCAPMPSQRAAGAIEVGGGADAGAVSATRSPVDPWEPFNRQMFAFNDAIDRTVLLPVATAYRDHVPRLVRRGIDNFLGNLGDIWTTVNEFLQFKIRDGFEMGTRVVANTTMGLGGLLDPATEMRLFKRREDFGQTLGRWGFGDGPYLVLPLLGPFTLRDAFAEPVDLYAGASTWLIDGQAAQISYTTANVVNTRANLIGTTEFIEGAAIDKYSFTRDAYLARRRNLVYDGNPPPEPFIDEGASDPADAASAPAEAASAPAQ